MNEYVKESESEVLIIFIFVVLFNASFLVYWTVRLVMVLLNKFYAHVEKRVKKKIDEEEIEKK